MMTIERIATLIGVELARRGLSVVIGPLGRCTMASDGVVLRWDHASATITVDTGTMFDRVLTLPMAERVLANLTAAPAVNHRMRYWLLDLLDGECRATTGHHLGLRSHAFRPWKGSPDAL